MCYNIHESVTRVRAPIAVEILSDIEVNRLKLNRIKLNRIKLNRTKREQDF